MKIVQSALRALMFGLCMTAFSVQAQTTSPPSPSPENNPAGPPPASSAPPDARGAMSSTPAPSAPMSSSMGATPMTKDQIKSQYKADQSACDAMKDKQKDLCQVEAKAKRDMAEADREANHKKMEAHYDVAKAKCNMMTGDAKDTCMKDAKAQYNP